MIVRIINDEPNQGSPKPTCDCRVLSDAIPRQSPGTNFQSNALLRGPCGQPIQSGPVKSVEWKIVSNLQEFHIQLATLIQQAVFIQGVRRLLPRHSHSPTKCISTNPELHVDSAYFCVISRTCSRMSASSKIFCQPSLNKTGFARLLIL